MLLNELLTESPQTQHGLEVIAYAVLNSMATQVSKLRDVNEIDRVSVTLEDVLGRNTLKRLDDKIKAFIKARAAMPIRLAHKNTKYLGAYYRAPKARIIIYVAKEDDLRILENDLAAYDTIRSTTAISFLRRFKTTLVHELVHAYDDFASQGKAFKHKIIPSEYDAYLSLPSEINARFMEVVKELEHKKLDGWQAYLGAFRFEFKGWKLLTDDQKKRLVRRLAAEYQQGRSPETLDISANVNALRERLHADGIDVWVSFYKPNDIIDISRLQTRDDSVRDRVVNAVFKLADTYRKTVVTSDLPDRYAREKGFQRNKGRNRNFLHREKWHRYPRR